MKPRAAASRSPPPRNLNSSTACSSRTLADDDHRLVSVSVDRVVGGSVIVVFQGENLSDVHWD